MPNQKTNLPRKHHYVPQTYLKLFCIPNTDRVAILDLHKGEIRKQRPQKILHQRDYFRQVDAPEYWKSEYVFEFEIGRMIDAKLKTIIEKLIQGGYSLTEDELVIFTLHLELQRLRVPKQLEMVKGIAKQMIEEIAYSNPEVAKEMRLGGYKIKVHDSIMFNYMRESAETLLLFRYLSRMIWSIWEAPPGIPFVTSDNAVTIVNPAIPPPGLAGIGLLGSIVLFPLTPTHMLELIHPETEGEKEPDYLRPVEVAPLPDTWFVHIRSGKTMSPKKALAANWLIASQAQRFLVSNDEVLLKKLVDLL